MERGKLNFEDWKPEKIILRMECWKIKFQKLETQKIIKDGMSKN